MGDPLPLPRGGMPRGEKLTTVLSACCPDNWLVRPGKSTSSSDEVVEFALSADAAMAEKFCHKNVTESSLDTRPSDMKYCPRPKTYLVQGTSVKCAGFTPQI